MKNKSIIFLICYIAYTSIYVARLNLSIASPELIASNVLNVAQVGFMGSAFSVIFAIGRFINGALSDRVPPYVMISSGLILAGISNIAISFLPPVWGIILFWAVNAFAQSMLWSSVLCIVSTLYDEETAKKKTSYMVTSVATGNIIGIILNTYIITKIGVSFAFIIPGAITLIMSTFIILSSSKIKPVRAEGKKHISIGKLLENKSIRTMFSPAMLHGVMKDNISLFMAVYFVDTFGIDLEKSAYFVLFIPAVGFVGRMIYPFFYKVCKNNEHKVSVFAFISCAVFAVPLCLKGVSPVLAAVCLSMIYAAVSVINTSILSIYPIRFVKTGNVASVSGIMDLATYMGAGLSGFIYGIVIKASGYVPMYISWAVISIVSIMFLGIIQRQKDEM